MTPQEMVVKIIGNLPKKTGKTIDQWVAIYQREVPTHSATALGAFKKNHGLGGITADVIASRANGTASILEQRDDLDAYVESQYSGARATLRPIFERVVQAALAFGTDVKVVPGKTQVTLTRSRQFAILWPKAGRIELGLALPGVPVGGLLQPVKGKDDRDRVRAFIRLEKPADVSAEVKRLLKQAYADDAKGLSATQSAALTRAAQEGTK